MPFWTKTNKTTKTARPTIAETQKVTSSEWNELTKDVINVNYQEFLDLKAIVDGADIFTPYIRKDIDFNITSNGVYVFFGSTPRAFTIDDGVTVVEIRTVANADLTLVGNINANHLGTIYQGTAATVFRWDSVDLEYNF